MILLSVDDNDDPNDVMAELHELYKNKLSASFDFDFNFDLGTFELFKNYNTCFIASVLKLANNKADFFIARISATYHLSTASRYPHSGSTEYQAWGFGTLKADFGHILIKPETFIDKIHEFVNPIELDFDDDKEFSRKFYVITSDKTKALLQMTAAFRDAVQLILTEDVVIEIVQNKIIIGNKKIITMDACVDFINFLDRISSI